MKNRIYKKWLAFLIASAVIFTGTSISAGAAVIDNYSVSDNEFSYGVATADEISLPEKYSSAELGFTTPVRYQRYNDCWGNAGLATYESKLLREGLDINLMSVNHLNVWATTRKNGKGWQRDFMTDGYAEITLGYLTSWQGGVDAETDDTLVPLPEIKPDDLPLGLVQYGVTSVEYYDNTQTEEIKRSIMQNGGIYAAYSQSGSCMTSDKLSYYMPNDYDGAYIGHAIEVVGWDDNYSRDNFNAYGDFRPENDGAWLVKNSWGDSFNALGGYFWMSYENKNIFGTKYAPSYAITSVQKIDENVRLEQNEIYGATYEFDYVDRDKITYMNKFDFSNGYNLLDKVIFETTARGAKYTIYYVPVYGGEPTADNSEWVKLDEGVVNSKGYICADIDNFNLPVTDGAIAVEIDASDIDGSATLGIGEWLKKSNGAYVFLNETTDGQSYIYYDDKLADVKDWYEENNDDQMGGTFVIKAVTNKTGVEVTLLGDADLNGKTDVNDVTLIQRYTAKYFDFSEVRKLNSDINKDGIINVNDVTELQRLIAYK